jgi:hypothetical protein
VKRLHLDWELQSMSPAIDGEYILYADHVEAMKRIAGAPVAQDLTFEKWLDDTSGFTSHDEGVARAAWDSAIASIGQPVAQTAAMTDKRIVTIAADYDLQYPDADIVAFARALLAQSAPSASAQPADEARARIEYFLKTWEWNGTGETIAERGDSPDTSAALTVADLRAILAAPAPVASPAAPKAMSDEDLDTLYWMSTGQSLRERDKRLAFTFGRAVERGVLRAVTEEQMCASPSYEPKLVQGVLDDLERKGLNAATCKFCRNVENVGQLPPPQYQAGWDDAMAEKASASPADQVDMCRALVAAAMPFVRAFEKTGIQSYEGADEKFTAFLDRNQITPAVTMGDFRRLRDAAMSATPPAADKE